VARLTDGFAHGAPLMRRALELLRDQPQQWLNGLPGRVAVELWEFDAARRLLTEEVRAARAAGALTGLPIVVNLLAALHVQAGEFAVAERVLREADGVTATTGDAPTDAGRLHLSAWRGEVQTAELVESVVADAERRGEGRQLSHAEYAMAVLNNGLGRYRTALTVSERALEHEELLGCWLLPELIEAAARSGEQEIAAEALDRLTERTRLCPTDWSAGIEARCAALLAPADEAQALHEEAIARLAAGGVATQAARARLLYGEWLRRERRQVEAREQLRAAYEMFDAMGADVFARRARRELLATGERARPRSAEASGELTARELQIATLAADGQTNPEIGRQLFISPRTVEYHLHKVFRKLSVSNRNQLAHALPEVAVIERHRSDYVPGIGAPLDRRVAAAGDGGRVR
jgi:DNA-binding NarL/FixJ family response regulator